MARNDSSAFYGRPYETADDAAEAALQALGWQSNVANQEYMGMIVKNPADGKYYRSDFQTQGQHDTSSWQGYPGGPVAGIVHSHPVPRREDRIGNDDFSRGDVMTAKEMKVPDYVAAIRAQGVRSRNNKFIPGVTPEMKQEYGNNSRGGVGSHGEQYLAQFPIDELVDHINKNSYVANKFGGLSKNQQLQIAMADALRSQQ